MISNHKVILRKVIGLLRYSKIAITTVEYERPSARGRKVFGEVVPWGIVWRTGAGYCTKVSFDKDVTIDGKKVPAGKYSLFTIPTPEQWTIILNTDTTLYGSYWYKKEKDVFRTTVTPKNSPRYYETLTIDIDLIPNNARIFISWADVQVNFDVITSTDAETKKFIEEELISRKSKNSNHYVGAADYLMYQNGDLDLAIELVNTAIELDEKNEWPLHLRVQLLEKAKKFDEALSAIKAYQRFVEKQEYEVPEQKEELLNTLKTDFERITNLKKK